MNKPQVHTKHLFTSERLGFRPWRSSDIPLMAAISRDPEVMKFFPAIATAEQTKEFILRMQTHYLQHGFCYFAVDELNSGTMIGFIGMMEQTYDADFTPCVDIGWRLSKTAWNKGYATEGANRVLQFGFNEIGLETIHAIAPVANTPSLNVMKKIGMTKVSEFLHPRLEEDSWLQPMHVYVKNRTEL